MNIDPSFNPPSRHSLFRHLARFSWLSIILSIISNSYITPILKLSHAQESRLIIVIVYGIWPFTGVLAGVIAFFGIPRYGRKGLLIPALTGICLWLLLFGLTVPMFFKVKELPKMRHAGKLAPAVHGIGAKQVGGADFGFSFDLPEGYEAITASEAPYAFVKKSSGEPNRIIMVSPIGRAIRNVRITDKDLPPGRNVSLTTFSWRGLEVDAFRVPETEDGIKYLTFNVQIPLRKEAVLLAIGGPAESEPELRSLVEQILSTFGGETNW